MNDRDGWREREKERVREVRDSMLSTQHDDDDDELIVLLSFIRFQMKHVTNYHYYELA